MSNNVNSGGTKLSKGDLALAKICAEWPDARKEIKRRLEKWERAGFNFRLEWLLRNVNTILTGEALFSALKDVNAASFQSGLKKAEKAVDTLLNLISSRLGLDHDRVLGSRYSFPVMTRYLDQKGGNISDEKERDKLLYWYIHTFLWGRYAGSTEAVMNQDLHLIEELEGGLDRLINQLRQNRGDLRLNANDFYGWSQGARFYPLLYMLTRVWKAKDWESNVELSAHLLGNLNTLQLHHIFPKYVLYKHGYSRPEVNALANFTFLTQDTNLKVLNKEPLDYIPYYESKNRGVVSSHWIPMDPELWKVENYKEFLAARCDLLAKAANEFLDSLVAGTIPESEFIAPVAEREVIAMAVSAETEEDRIIRECNEWIVQQGLPPGEVMYELADLQTGEPRAILDLAWPNGLQVGLSQPVALLIDESKETEEAVNKAGYRHFTDIESFKEYVNKEILALQTVVK